MNKSIETRTDSSVQNSSSSRIVNLFVGSLPFSMTQEDLEKSLLLIAPVSDVRLIIDKKSLRSKGYGFFSAQKKDRQLFLDSNIQHEGLAILIKDGFTVDDEDTPENRVFFRIFPKESRLEDLNNSLSKMNKLKYVHLYERVDGTSKGYGFIEFDSSKLAQSLLKKNRVKLGMLELVFFNTKFLVQKALKREKRKLAKKRKKAQNNGETGDTHSDGPESNPQDASDGHQVCPNNLVNSVDEISLVPHRKSAELEKSDKSHHPFFNYFGVHHPSQNTVGNIMRISTWKLNANHHFGNMTSPIVSPNLVLRYPGDLTRAFYARMENCRLGIPWHIYA